MRNVVKSRRAGLKYFLLAFFLLPVRVGAQNLVPNPSFEEHTKCPDNLDEVNYATDWWGVNNTPDYFDSCATVWYASVPTNVSSPYRTAFTGNAYAGLITYELPAGDPNYREVIACKLISPIIAGKQYSLSMEISCAGRYGFAIAANNIGMRFSNQLYTDTMPVPINNFAQVYEDTLIKDTVNWIKLLWTYTSDSTYKYLYIGNFFDDNHTDTLTLGVPHASGEAYYFIGEVSINCMSAVCTDDIINVKNIMSDAYYDEVNREIRININNSNRFQVCLYDGFGNKLISAPAISSINTSSFSKGIYFLSIIDNQNIYTKKILIY